MKTNKFVFKYLYLNLILLILNLYLKSNSKNNIFKKFKIVDKAFISFCKKTFKEISFEINKKYYRKYKLLNNLFINQQNFEKNRTISLYIEDNQGLPLNYIINLLKRKYYVKITQDNPDYLIYNVFGCNHLDEKYKNSIKIAFFSENQIPDFNTANYAVSQYHIHYLDRYFKFPYFLNYLGLFKYSDYKKIKKEVLNKDIRKKFCAAVITNYQFTDYFRLDFINELSKYKTVDMGGKYKNNVGNVENKIEFLKSYKFSIAMENTEGNGYITEKIIESFLAGTIPIYYGDYMADEFINPKSFILITGEKDMKKKIEYIIKIDKNDDLYRKILKEKIFNDENILKKTKKEYADFLLNIFEQDKKKAKRVDNIKFNNY